MEDEIVLLILVERNWVTSHGYERLFGYTGVQQFVLDIHTILKVCDSFVTSVVTKAANDACSKALKIYFKRAKDPSWILKGGDWYDRRVEETIRKGGPDLKNFGKPVQLSTASTASASSATKTASQPKLQTKNVSYTNAGNSK